MKLKALKPKIRMLTRETVGNLIKKSNDAFETLFQKHETNSTNLSPGAVEEEREAYTRWEWVAGLDEKYLKQRSKLHWMQV